MYLRLNYRLVHTQYTMDLVYRYSTGFYRLINFECTNVYKTKEYSVWLQFIDNKTIFTQINTIFNELITGLNL